MSVDPVNAEKAQSLLWRLAKEKEALALDAKDKARLVKYKHALAVVRLDNVPITVRKEHAWADDEVQEAQQEADKADARNISSDALWDAAKSEISIYQSKVKDAS